MCFLAPKKNLLLQNISKNMGMAKTEYYIIIQWPGQVLPDLLYDFPREKIGQDLSWPLYIIQNQGNEHPTPRAPESVELAPESDSLSECRGFWRVGYNTVSWMEWVKCDGDGGDEDKLEWYIVQDRKIHAPPPHQWGRS